MNYANKRIIRSNFDYLKLNFPDETLHSMCYEKTRYQTFNKCNEKIKEIQEKRNDKLRIYSCPICKGFHLTSKV